MSGAKKFVFCEGKDDVLVVRALVNTLELDITIEEYGGKGNLTNFLKGIATRPEFAQQKVATIAILRDADENAESAFASVRDILRSNGFDAPEANEHFKESNPRVGIFIVGVQGKGMIEDLCLQSIAGQAGYDCVDSYSFCIAQKLNRKELTSKEKVRVWMAWQEHYDSRVGKAAVKGYWPWASPAFDDLKKFLRAL